ncbi:MAG TPA: choice-of-anchor D domain-containing protein [Solirubrobacteraceae bacterium]
MSRSPAWPLHLTRIAGRAAGLALILVVVLSATAAATSTPPIFGGPALIDKLAPFPGFPGTELTSISCASATFCVAAGGNIAQYTTDAGGAAPPDWSTPDHITSASIDAVSCPTASLCVAVTTDGHALRTTDGGQSWSAPVALAGGAQAVSCTIDGICVVGDTAGNLDVSLDGGQTWTVTGQTPGGAPFYKLSCFPGVCVAIDADASVVFTSRDVGGGSPPTWTQTAISGGPFAFLTDLSCTANGVCVAVDSLGYAFATSDVTAATPSWSTTLADGTGSFVAGLVNLVSIACAENAASPATDLCVGGDFLGRTDISTDVGGPGPDSWSIVPTFDTGSFEGADGPNLHGLLTPVACVPSGWCMAADINGNVTYAEIPLANPASTVWSPESAFDGQDAMAAVSCAQNGQLCAARDTSGHAVTTVDGGVHWAPASTIGPFGAGGEGVSCVSGGICLAVENVTVGVPRDPSTGVNQPTILRSTPTAAGASWTSTTFDFDGTYLDVPTGQFVTSISCVDSGLCVAVDEGGGSAISTDLGVTWSTVPTGDVFDSSATSGPSGRLDGVSCASSTLCVAVDSAGFAMVSTNAATTDPSWSVPARIDPVGLTSVSCTTRGLCVATDAAGHVVTTTDAGRIWSKPLAITGAVGLAGVSCTSAGLCAATGSGSVFYTTNPQAPGPNWALASSETAGLTGVSCVGTGLCIAVDDVGDASIGESQVPKVAVSGLAGAFANTILGQSSSPQRATITNTGAAPLNVSGAALTGTDAGEFAISSDTCEGVFVPPGGSCSVAVSFAPATTGSFSGASLEISSDAQSSPDDVPLFGTGVLGPVLSTSGDAAAFPSTAVGSVSPVERITTTNTGGAPLHVSVTALTGGDAADFKLSAPGGCAGAVLAPGASCSIGVEFAPTTTGPRSASVEVDSDAQAGRLEIPVGGTGVAAPVASNAFSLLAVKAGRRGVITAQVRLPRAGSFALSTSSMVPLAGGTSSKRKPKAKRITYSRSVAAAIKGPTTATIRITPGKAGAAALKVRHKLRVVVAATFAPAGVARRTETSSVTVRGG